MGRRRARCTKDGEALRTLSVEEFNSRLEKLRKKARKGKARPKAGSKREVARVRWQLLKDAGCKSSCCGKAVKKMCSKCPRLYADLVLEPLKSR